MNKPQIEVQADNKREDELVDAMEQELTDEQLLQMAEGSSSWGANCNSSCN
jgi:hypothetical protein